MSDRQAGGVVEFQFVEFVHDSHATVVLIAERPSSAAGQARENPCLRAKDAPA